MSDAATAPAPTAPPIPWLGLTAVLGVDLGRHRQAGPEPVAKAVGVVDQDLHGHSLHHLGEVAGGVVRRQQGELRA